MVSINTHKIKRTIHITDHRPLSPLWSSPIRFLYRQGRVPELDGIFLKPVVVNVVTSK